MLDFRATPVLIAAGLALVAGSAQADSFDFSIVSTNGNIDGVFTATAVSNGYDVTNVAGELNGTSFDSAVNGYGGSDNELFPAGPYYADRAGIAFEAGGLDYNIFHNGTEGKVYSFCVSNVEPACSGGQANDAPVATFTVGASAAPEPATWALMLAGIGGVGLMLRRAKKTMGLRLRDAFAA